MTGNSKLSKGIIIPSLSDKLRNKSAIKIRGRNITLVIAPDSGLHSYLLLACSQVPVNGFCRFYPQLAHPKLEVLSQTNTNRYHTNLV